MKELGVGKTSQALNPQGEGYNMLRCIGRDRSDQKVQCLIMGHSRFEAYAVMKCKAPVAKYNGLLIPWFAFKALG